MVKASMVKQRKPQEGNIGPDQGRGGRDWLKENKSFLSLTPEDTLALGPLHPHSWKHFSV